MKPEAMADADENDKGHLETLEAFHREVWGWLLKRGLVDNDDDDEWRGFVDVIEEHEAEIEACAIRACLAALSNPKAPAAQVVLRTEIEKLVCRGYDNGTALVSLNAVLAIVDADLVATPPAPTSAVDGADLITRITSFLSGHLSGPIQSRGNALLEEAVAALSKATLQGEAAVDGEAVKALEWKLRSSAFSDEWKANTVGGRYLSKRYCQCANSKTNPCIVCGLPKFIDPEWLKRKIEEDRDEGEIGAGFELFPLPEAPAAPVPRMKAEEIATHHGGYAVGTIGYLRLVDAIAALVATPPASEAYPPKSLLQTAERIIDAQRAEKKRRGIGQ
ncbi:hypothetical protein [Mesorhizobium sp. M0520]|uniref:hypothetical protein n=1 Tax=Mesorhizobium sp. M0520 TaxID=2956957 RepID=UPI0033370404